MAKFYYTDTKNEIKVGGTAYYPCIENEYSSERRREVVGELVVTKIGNKYITFGERWNETKRENTEGIYQLRENVELYFKMGRTRRAIEKYFSGYGRPTNNLTDDQVKQIATILNISI